MEANNIARTARVALKPQARPLPQGVEAGGPAQTLAPRTPSDDGRGWQSGVLGRHGSSLRFHLLSPLFEQSKAGTRLRRDPAVWPWNSLWLRSHECTISEGLLSLAGVDRGVAGQFASCLCVGSGAVAASSQAGPPQGGGCVHPEWEIPLGRQEHRGFPGDKGSVRGSLSSGQPRGLPGMRDSEMLCPWLCWPGFRAPAAELETPPPSPHPWTHMDLELWLPAEVSGNLLIESPPQISQPLGLSLGPGCRAVGAVPRFCLVPCPLAKTTTPAGQSQVWAQVSSVSARCGQCPPPG